MDDIPPLSVFRNRLDAVCANSFCDFHAKGLDYLCLHRSPELTVKAYFYDGDILGSPDLVVPHDHRYRFETTVLAGSTANLTWQETTDNLGSQVYQRFDFYTPLNGGDGFHWNSEVRLSGVSDRQYQAGESYVTTIDDIHTLSRLAPNTVLLLRQYADEMPIGQPSRAYRLGNGHEGPSLSGLYNRMTPDKAIRLFERLR